MNLLLVLISICCVDCNVTSVADTTIVTSTSRYIGEYPSGEGVLYSDSLGIIIGHFENGVPNGVCTHYSKNGNQYYGEFAEGRYSGRGMLLRKSGVMCVGNFQNDRGCGIDTIYYNMNSIYVGACKNGVPHGEGVLYIHKASGRKYYFMEGLFVDGKFTSGLYSNSYGVFSTAGGNFTADYHKGNSDIEIYSQLELQYRYESLKALKPKKFPGAKLTEEQRRFLERQQ